MTRARQLSAEGALGYHAWQRKSQKAFSAEFTMKYGMNLLLWTGEMNDGMIPVLAMLKNLGFDGVELPIFNPDLDYARWGKILDDFGLARTAVTVRGADDNPISPDAAIRHKGIEGNC